MKTQHDMKGLLQQNNQKKFNGLAGIFILLISVAILTTFSAFSPSSSDLPLDYQNIDVSIEEPPLSTEESSIVDVIINEFEQQNRIIVSVPDSTKKTEKEMDRDTDQDVDSDSDNDKELEEDKVFKKELEEAEKELEKAEIEIDRAMEIYNQAMIEYQKTLSKNKNLIDIEAWTSAEKEYEKALALAEFHREHIDISIPDFDELQITEILEDHLESLEEWSLEEHIEIPDQLFEEVLELQELEHELISAEMEEQLSMIQDQLNLQMEKFEDVLADQIEELEDVRMLEFDAQLLETNIKSELIKDNLIENENENISFILSAKKLEINGQTLSQELHKKYLKLYEDITDERLEGTTKLIFQD